MNPGHGLMKAFCPLPALRMPGVGVLCALTIAAAALLAGSAQAAPWQEMPGSERLLWANDDLFGTDNQFTNGLAYRRFSALRTHLDATEGTPAVGKFMARPLLPEARGLYFREGWAIAHNMQTPDEIKIREINLDDVPYMGMVGWSNSFVGFDDQRFVGVEWLVGWVGKATLAKPLQRSAHRLTGARRPRGWRHQLDNEPIFNLYYTRKRKLFSGERIDAAVSLDAALGTYFTYGQVGLELRMGRLPGGFAHLATPVGKGLQYDATLREPGASYAYVSAVVAGTRLLHAMPRDGSVLRRANTWTRENRVRPESTIGRLILGFHYERPQWSGHLNLWLGTDAVDPRSVVNRQDPQNNFAVITLERRL